MFRSLSSLLLAAPLLIMGCAGQSPRSEPQPVYGDAEAKSFALKALSASDLPSDLYARYRRALTEAHRNHGEGAGS